MNNKIVLGYPYEGAMFWLLSAEQWRGSKLKSSYKGFHPYYKTLYGRKHADLIEEVVSLSILFDQIYLAPADTYYPENEKYLHKGYYKNPEIGIYSSWNWMKDRDFLEFQTDSILNDRVINIYLHKVPTLARRQIIRQTILQLFIAKKFKANVMGNNGYLKMLRRIKFLIEKKERNTDLIIKNKKRYLDALKSIFHAASLNFKITSLDDFIALRKNKELRRYAFCFRKYAENKQTEIELYKAMSDAIETFDLSKKISGGLDVTASLLGAISLLPKVGNVIDFVGTSADLLSKTIGQFGNKYKWWSLAPKISETLSKSRIQKKYKKLLRQN